MLKTPSKSISLGFQRYRQFCPTENNKIQKELHTIIGCIYKSIFPTYDSFCLITSHNIKSLEREHWCGIISRKRSTGQHHSSCSTHSGDTRVLDNTNIMITCLYARHSLRGVPRGWATPIHDMFVYQTHSGCPQSVGQHQHMITCLYTRHSLRGVPGVGQLEHQHMITCLYTRLTQGCTQGVGQHQHNYDYMFVWQTHSRGDSRGIGGAGMWLHPSHPPPPKKKKKKERKRKEKRKRKSKQPKQQETKKQKKLRK